MHTNNPFIHEHSICGIRYQTIDFLKITLYVCLRRDATLTVLLDGVFFDVLDVSLVIYISLSWYRLTDCCFNEN